MPRASRNSSPPVIPFFPSRSPRWLGRSILIPAMMSKANSRSHSTICSMERRDADKRDVASVPSHDRLSLLTPSLVPTQLNAADGALVLHELALRVMSDEERARRGAADAYTLQTRALLPIVCAHTHRRRSSPYSS